MASDVFIVFRHKFYGYPHYRRRSVVVGVTSKVEKAWKLIERDFRLIPNKERFTEGNFYNCSPWEDFFDIVEFSSEKLSPELEYEIRRYPIDLFDD